MKTVRVVLGSLAVVWLGLNLPARSPQVLAQGKDEPAQKLVGVWEVTKSAGDLPVGATLEFTKDGKLKAVLKVDDQEIKIEGTYKVEKDKIAVKVKIGEETVEETVTIKKLTNTELEVEDKEAKVTSFVKKKQA
ncbi:MAG: hypothetical protein NZ703_01610 [Gemmataceae bacterium]|nr:hypothetical protein [Gemmataceae bacterium]MCS7269755.1 hypothetical protein [Gemmataceae bacterium]MDW8244144.1 hypothetical protein [Thermogemmata sp.]